MSGSQIPQYQCWGAAGVREGPTDRREGPCYHYGGLLGPWQHAGRRLCRHSAPSIAGSVNSAHSSGR
ncbi:hypothetical protein GDO81_029121 [Engystomops pustulosus]|uniref:MHC class I antigen n=1 Tax=Engystomops pustulosus TaxID=76066 RepID=A0AAV6YCI3_ENGPU|nr:hypothetical protein GDO81_029121 [Engystomops pustulosus]